MDVTVLHRWSMILISLALTQSYCNGRTAFIATVVYIAQTKLLACFLVYDCIDVFYTLALAMDLCSPNFP